MVVLGSFFAQIILPQSTFFFYFLQEVKINVISEMFFI